MNDETAIERTKNMLKNWKNVKISWFANNKIWGMVGTNTIYLNSEYCNEIWGGFINKKPPYKFFFDSGQNEEEGK